MDKSRQAAALAFIEEAELPAAPHRVRSGVTAEPGPQVSETPAALVGSEIISFVQGVTPERRQLVVQSSLLAQLVAKKKVPDDTQVPQWYQAYLDCLRNIGWAVQDTDFKSQTSFAAGFDAHEQIVQAATALLGGGPALAAVIATINALRQVSDNKPWFTVFQREVQKSSTAHFQVTLVEPGVGDAFLVKLMAFAITAEEGLTQVAFFRFNSRQAQLRTMSAQVTVGLEPGSAVAQAIEEKVGKYQSDYVRALDI